MFSELTWLQTFIAYFLSGIAFGLLFFVGMPLIGKLHYSSVVRFIAIVMFLASLAFAMLAISLWVLLFFKDFLLSLILSAIVIFIIWRIGK